MGYSIAAQAIIVCAVALPVLVQERYERQNLQREARISMEQARRAALARQPGTITSAELDRENGRPVYSFDVAGRDGLAHEIEVDAITGRVISDRIESDPAFAPGARDPRRPPPFPGEMRPGVVPPSITNTGEYAEDIYDAVAAGRWGAARSRFPELRRAAERARTAVPHEGRQQAQLDASVDALGAALSARNRFAALQQSNRITLIAANLSERFHPVVPADIARLDYYGRELQIYAARRNMRELGTTVSEMRRTWERVRPGVEARGGFREARRFDSIMARLETARNPAAYSRLAAQVLDEVDRLEAVFTQPATA